MIRIKNLNLQSCKSDLAKLPEGKLLINTINAYSYNNARHDQLFQDALLKGDVLIPDGMSIVYACKLFRKAKSKPCQRIAGHDLFSFEMNKLNQSGGKVMFLGSSEKVLKLIRERAAEAYPNLEVVTYSPPYKPEFSEQENQAMVDAINQANPDLLWIGMTAPKQEKWTYANWSKLNIHCHVGTIGAVFDFFAGTKSRAPRIFQKLGLEWLHRLIVEPRRMWRRYLIGNTQFMYYLAKEKLGK